jgi:energy-coupling factor transport system ATP-binding protein
MPFMLGRGQQQRLAIASILSMNPQVLIIDEPTTGLDWHECIRVMELVKKLNENGHTIIMTTHNMNLVALYAKHVVVLRHGEKLLDGTVEEVFRETEMLKSAYIKAPELFRVMSSFPEIKLKDHSVSGVAAQICEFLNEKEGEAACQF